MDIFSNPNRIVKSCIGKAIFEAYITDGYSPGEWIAYRNDDGIPTVRNFDTGEVMQADNFKILYKVLDFYCRESLREIRAERSAG